MQAPPTGNGGNGIKFNFEQIARRLMTAPQSLQCAIELRERIELVHTNDYVHFLRWLFPAFRNLLLSTPSDNSSENQKLRHTILEILNRLPNNDVLRPYVSELLRLATEILSKDNEDNALTCLRIIFDLHKNYRPALEDEVQSFLTLVQQIYHALPDAVQHFSNDTKKRGIESFKVLTECPLIVMLLFQLYPRFIQENIPMLTPLMMRGLQLKPQGRLDHKLKQKYRELIACQVKTLSFLTYLLRGFSELMKPYSDSISKAVISLMVSCPSEAIATRKELLVATRHILATEFRRGFFRYVDIMLDEKVLIGDQACFDLSLLHNKTQRTDTLRPLAYSTLADLIHHVRAQLSMPQRSRVIFLYSKILHDTGLPVSVQATSVRLMLNLVDYIFHNQNTKDRALGRTLLVSMLHTLTSKLDTLRFIVYRIVALKHANNHHASSSHDLNTTNVSVSTSNTKTIFKDRPQGAAHNEDDLRKKQQIRPNTIVTLKVMRQEASTELTEIKSLLQTLVLGLKTIIWCLSNYESKKHQASLHDAEIMTIRNFFRWGIMSCRLFIMGQVETKDLVDNFASAFTVLPPQVIRAAIGSQMDFIFDTILGCRQLVEVFQVLLANPNASNVFGEILFAFLFKSKLNELDFPAGGTGSGPHPNVLNPPPTSDTSNMEPTVGAVSAKARQVSARDRAVIVLRLFKTVFGSIALFPGNGSGLVTQFGKFSQDILTRATKARNPQHYFALFRSFLRYILGSSLSVDQNLSQEFRKFHILDTLLRIKTHLVESAPLHAMLTEIIMLLPCSVKFKEDLVWVSKLLPVLAQALLSNCSDLASLSLRTLEHYLDSMGPSWLLNLLAKRPFLHTSILGGVCLHLKPAPNTSGVRALRILGKLGGNNRHFLSGISAIHGSAPSLQYLSDDYGTKEDAISLKVSLPLAEANLEPDEMSFCLNGCLRDVFDLFANLTIKNLSTHGDVLQSLSSRRLAAAIIENDALNNNIQNAVVSRYRSLSFQFVASTLSALLLTSQQTKARQLISFVFAAAASEVPEAPAYLHNLCQVLVTDMSNYSIIIVAMIDALESGSKQIAMEALKAIKSTLELIQKPEDRQNFALRVIEAVSLRLSQIQPSWFETCRVFCAVLRDAPQWLLVDHAFQVEPLLKALRIFEAQAPFLVLNEIFQALSALVHMPNKEITAGVWSDCTCIRIACQAIVTDNVSDDLSAWLTSNADDEMPLAYAVGGCDAICFVLSMGPAEDEFIQVSQDFIVKSLDRAHTYLDEDEAASQHQISSSDVLNIQMLEDRQFLDDKMHTWYILGLLKAIHALATTTAQWPQRNVQGQILGFVLKCLADNDGRLVTAASSALLRLVAGDNGIIDIVSRLDLQAFVDSVLDRVATTEVDALIHSLHAVFLIPQICVRYATVLVDTVLSRLNEALDALTSSETAAKLIVLLTCTRLPADASTSRYMLISKLVKFVIAARKKLRKTDRTQECISTTSISNATDFMDASRVCSVMNKGAQRDQFTYVKTMSCPLQDALTTFLACYPSEAVTFFLQRSRLADAESVLILQNILSSDKGKGIALFLQSRHGLRRLLCSAFHDVLDTEYYFRDSALLSGNTDDMLPEVKEEFKEEFKEVNAEDQQELLRVHGLQVLIVLQSSHENLFTSQNEDLIQVIRVLWRKSYLRNRREAILAAASAAASSASTAKSEDTELQVKLFCSQKKIFAWHDESYLLVLCLIHISRGYDRVAILYELLATVNRSNPHDNVFLLEFRNDEIAELFTPDQVQPLLLLFLRTWCNENILPEFKMLALRLLVIPVLGSALKKSDVGVSDDLLRLFVNVTLNNATILFNSSSNDDSLRVELLKLTTILIESAGVQLADQRKEIIKFAWSHLKTDDSPSRLWAYVNVCHFIATYDTPPKIVLQVYVSLLRTYQPESRDLVRIGLDVVIPVLPDRLQANDFVKAIKWTKKIMYEEGHTLAQLIHMWQIIVRHPWLFCQYRIQFLPHMVNSLNRLGLPPNCPIENRELAVSLAELMISWEEKSAGSRNGNNTSTQQKDETSSDPSSSEEKSSLVPGNMVDMLVNFLVRLALFASDNKEVVVQKLAAKCLKLLEISLKKWPVASIRFSYFDKLISSSGMKSSPSSPSSENNQFTYSVRLLATCLGIISATLLEEGKTPNPFFLENVHKVQDLVCPCFSVNDAEVQSRLCKVLSRLSQVYPPGISPSLAWVVFYQRIKIVIETRLANLLLKTRSLVVLVTAGRSSSTKPIESHPHMVEYWSPLCENLLSTLKQIAAICEYTPSYVMNHANSILCVAQFTLLLISNKDSSQHKFATPTMALISSWSKSEVISTNEKKDTSKDLNNSVATLKTCLSLLASVVLTRMLPTLRRPFLALLFACMQKTNVELVLFVVGILDRWLVSSDSPLTHQEHEACLVVLSQVDHYPETLAVQVHSHFLDILKAKAVDKQSQRTSSAYEMQLMSWGLLAPHAGIRRESFSRVFWALPDHYALRVYELMNYSWSPVSTRFWPVVITEALLLSMDWNTPLVIQGSPVVASDDIKELLFKYCATSAALLRPLTELIHANVPLAHRLFEAFVPKILRASIFTGSEEWSEKWSKAFLQHFQKNTHHSAPVRFRSVVELFDKSYFDLPNKCDTQLHSLESGLEVKASSNEWHSHNSLLNTYSRGLRLPATRAPSTIPDSLLSVMRLHQRHVKEPHLLLQQFNETHQTQAQYVLLTLAEDILFYTSSSKGSAEFYHMVLKVLSALQEDEVHAYLFETFVSPEETIGFSLERNGFMMKAQDYWFQKIQSSLSAISQEEPSAEIDILRAQIYCSEWTNCARQLSQWPVVATMLRSTNSVSATQSKLLQLEAAAHCRAWHDVRYLCREENAGRKYIDVFDAKLMLYQARLAVIDLEFDKSDKLCTQCIQVALNLWNTFPRLSADSKIHNAVLHLFHELTEVHESSQLLQKIQQGSDDISAVSRAWRRRLPSMCDALPLWENIFSWRETVFSLLVQQSKTKSLDDSLWTKSMLARIARKQQLAHIAEQKLANTESLVDQSNDDGAFFVFREKALLYKAYPSKVENERIFASKHLLEQASLDDFSTQHHSELERIKANVFGLLGSLGEAHRSFSKATSVQNVSGRAWYEWAVLCEASTVEQSIELQTKMRQYALTCHLAAIECGHDLSCVAGIARILNMLKEDTDLELRQLLLDSKRIDILPATSLILWLPQLLQDLGSAVDGSLMCALIEKLVEAFPESVYYSLRLLHRNKAATTTTSESSRSTTTNRRKRSRGASVPIDENSVLKTNTTKLMALSRWKHSNTVASIDILCDGLVSHFQPGVYAKWAAILHALYQHSIDAVDTRVPLTPKTSQLIKQMNQQLNVSLSSFDSLEEMLLSPELKEIYDLCVREAIAAVQSLPEHIIRLKASPILLPCQYYGATPETSELIRMASVQSRVRPSMTEEGQLAYKVAMHGDDGKTYYFELIPGKHIRNQVNELIDFCILRSLSTKKKALRMPAEVACSIGQNLMIKPAQNSRLCLSTLSQTDPIAMSQRRRIAKSFVHVSNLSAAVYNSACRQTSADLLLHEISSVTADAQSFWNYRKLFAKQFAAISFSDFVLMTEKRKASQISIGIHKASISLAGQKPFSNESSTSSFRLSRNIERVIQPLMLGSIFKPCLGALATAIDADFSDANGFLYPALSLALSTFSVEQRADYLNLAKKNVHSISPRAAAAYSENKDDDNNNSQEEEHGLEAGLTRLIESALSPSSLALCPPSWQPWL